MRSPEYSDRKIAAILKQNESGVSVAELCQEHGISLDTLDNWRASFNTDLLIEELREVRAENERLRAMCSEERFISMFRQGLIDGKY